MRVNNERDDQLPSVLFLYHVSKQESTGVSPSEMMYGCEVRLPLISRGRERLRGNQLEALQDI